MSVDKDMAFQLIHDIRHLNMFLGPQCHPFHLRRNEMMALGCISHAYERGLPPMTPSQIGQTLGISRPAMTAVLNTLEEKELILRTMDHHDKRKILVELSQKGKNRFTELQAGMLGRISKIMTVLGEENSQTLLLLLQQAMEVVEEEMNRKAEEHRCEELQSI